MSVRTKILFTLLTTLFLSGFNSSFTQTLLRSNFDKSNYIFELTFTNENNYTVFATKIGAFCKVVSGGFNCQSTSFTPDPFSEYYLRLIPNGDTAYMNIIPIISLQPKETKTLFIGTVPNISNACENWELSISSVMKFQNGYKFISSPENINSQEIKSINTRKLTDQEILTSINSADPEQKIRAISDIRLSTIPITTIENIISARLNEPDSRVRYAATLATKDLKFNNLTELLVKNLLSSSDIDERTAIIHTFGRLKDGRCTDALINKVVNGDINDAKLAARTLVDIQNIDVINKARFILQRHIKWATGTPEEKERYSMVVGIVIAYKDMYSVPTLKTILADEAIVEVKYDVLNYMNNQLRPYKVESDKFISGFIDEYNNLLNNKNENVRSNALNLLCASNAEIKDKTKALRKIIKDPVYYLKCRAAVWAGELGMTEFGDDIKVICKAATGPEYDEVCSALVKLKIPID